MESIHWLYLSGNLAFTCFFFLKVLKIDIEKTWYFLSNNLLGALYEVSVPLQILKLGKKINYNNPKTLDATY